MEKDPKFKKEDLEEYDIFVDFGNGDKFIVSNPEIDHKAKKIILHGCQGQMGWVKIDALHKININEWKN